MSSLLSIRPSLLLLLCFHRRRKKNKKGFFQGCLTHVNTSHNTTGLQRMKNICLLSLPRRNTSQPALRRSVTAAALLCSACGRVGTKPPFWGLFLALLTSPCPLCSSGRVCPGGPGQQRGQQNTHGLTPGGCTVFCTHTHTFTHTHTHTHAHTHPHIVTQTHAQTNTDTHTTTHTHTRTHTHTHTQLHTQIHTVQSAAGTSQGCDAE